jgi:hypothetical protein
VEQNWSKKTELLIIDHQLWRTSNGHDYSGPFIGIKPFCCAPSGPTLSVVDTIFHYF